MNRLFCLVALAVVISSTRAKSIGEDGNGRAFPIFNIVKFANDECEGSDDTTGTCYTKDECSQRNGVEKGTCAEGFGVCCVFNNVRCGATIGENNTFLIANDDEKAAGSCTYKICPCSSDVCRIRYEFTALTLATQNEGTVVGGGALSDLTDRDSIGACATDTFQINNLGGGSSSPVICGPNTGHHMILDSDGSSCHDIVIGKMGTFARDWNIQVRQYGSSVDKDNTAAGPPGCLQYFRARTSTTTGAADGTGGQVVNYGTTAADLAAGAMIGATQTHLANQNYRICFRRFGNCGRVCLTPRAVTGTAAVINQAGFGLSISAAIAAQNNLGGAGCTTDYLTIPGGVESTGAGMSMSRYCGRFLNNIAAQTASVTICTQAFSIGVTTNAGEAAIARAGADMNERDAFPGGIIGFRMAYEQQTAAGGACM